MKWSSRLLLYIGVVLFAAILVTTSGSIPAAGQDDLPLLRCGFGAYWLVSDILGDTVWIRGSGDVFGSYSALRGETDLTARLTLSLDGRKVFANSIIDPNPEQMLSCAYNGEVGRDGLSVQGMVTCQTPRGQTDEGNWSATIQCGMPVISWTDTAAAYRAAKGQKFALVCLPGQSIGIIYGTDIYTDDSAICTAATHAGIIDAAKGGQFLIEILPGQESYEGSERHGVNSNSYGQWQASYRFEKRTANEIPIIQESFRLDSYRGFTGQYAFHCLPVYELGTVWGTGIYTDDSSVCSAAVHAGIISMSGGDILVELRPGQESYQGSMQNGIQSRDYGVWAGSYSFVRK